MKQVLAAKGIKVPEFSPVESATDLAVFLEEHGYPVVVKPRKGYSSINTAVLRSDEDLQRFLKKSFGNGIVDPSLDLEVEVFIKGQMNHIDGLVYNNEIKLVSPSKYLGVVVNFENNPLLAGCALSPNNPLTKRLQQFIANCITALEGPSCFAFHAEVCPQNNSADASNPCVLSNRHGIRPRTRLYSAKSLVAQAGVRSACKCWRCTSSTLTKRSLKPSARTR